MTITKRIGIAIDAWKLTIFRRRLEAAGFTWTEHAGVAKTLLLRVETDQLHKLKETVEAANTEAATVSHKEG